MPISRLRLYDLLNSRFPAVFGYCASHIPQVAEMANAVQERLVTCREAGDHGWYGSYAEMVFNVSQDEPSIVLPRGVARLTRLNACDTPIPVRNQFYEFLAYGSGNWPKADCAGDRTIESGELQGFHRGVVATFADLTTPDHTLRIYSNTTDDGKRILINCKDANALQVTTLDSGNLVQGCFVTLAAPFADLVLPTTTTALEVSEILGIQKDTTLYPVSVYEVDQTTGAESLLVTMEPGETVAAYVKYYLDSLPAGCCCAGDSSTTVQVRAIAKMDLVPVAVPPDYLLIQSREAMIEEGHALRFAGVEAAGALERSERHHRAAIRFLNGQLTHYEGKETVAVNFAPFGCSRLSRQRIGYQQ